MSPSRIRYVTACQQILALGVVLAALAPAAGVVSLDVVREAPASGRGMSIGEGALVTSGRSDLVSAPEPATGHDAVSVTWAGGSEVAETAVAQVRTRTDGRWSGWSEMVPHDGNGPDPESEPALRREVDRVQVRVTSLDGDRVPDLRVRRTGTSVVVVLGGSRAALGARSAVAGVEVHHRAG